MKRQAGKRTRRMWALFYDNPRRDLQMRFYADKDTALAFAELDPEVSCVIRVDVPVGRTRGKR